MPSGKLLGFIVSYRGIEANPEKLKDIFRMNSPTKLKDVQKLTGCMEVLSRFVSRLGERAMPFYKLLKKQDKFQWTLEAQQAFRAYVAIMITMYVAALSPPEIWSFARSKSVNTNSLQYRRALTSSVK